jgi:replicative DNA helicase
MKQLPNNLELEKSVLWYIINNWNEVEDIFIDLQLEYFYDSNIWILIKNIYEMFCLWDEVSLITIDNKLKNKPFYIKAWGQSYLIELSDIDYEIRAISTMISNLQYLYKQREIIKQARHLEQIWYSENLDDWVTECFENITNTLNEWKSKITDMEDSINSLKTFIEENKNKKMIWYSWGQEWIDNYTWWIRKWKMYRIWGMSWAWKTSLIYEVIDNLLNQNVKVMFVSLENAIQTTLINFLSVKQWVNPREIEKGRIEADYNYINKHKHNLKILDKINNLNDIKREILKTRPEVVILDYIW